MFGRGSRAQSCSHDRPEPSSCPVDAAQPPRHPGVALHHPGDVTPGGLRQSLVQRGPPAVVAPLEEADPGVPGQVRQPGVGCRGPGSPPTAPSRPRSARRTLSTEARSSSSLRSATSTIGRRVHRLEPSGDGDRWPAAGRREPCVTSSAGPGPGEPSTAGRRPTASPRGRAAGPGGPVGTSRWREHRPRPRRPGSAPPARRDARGRRDGRRGSHGCRTAGASGSRSAGAAGRRPGDPWPPRSPASGRTTRGRTAGAGSGPRRRPVPR